MELLNFYKLVRNRTVEICQPLKVEDYVPQPVPFASPPKWHLAHTTWFFEQMILKKFMSDYEVFHDAYGYLFNSYYNFVGERAVRADRGNMTRPSVNEVYEYRDFVDNQMEKLIERNSEDIKDLLILGLNHEQQHQELLLTDLKYSLGHNPLFPVYKEGQDLVNKYAPENENWIEIESGIYEIGHRSNTFSYDNEHGAHRVFLEPFSVRTNLVSNQEFLEFINAGGYQKFHLWLDEGWSWVQENDVKSPLYWHKINGNWQNYTLNGLKDLDLNAPVCHISFYEANAFATWKGMRLLTEFEWEIASKELNWGERWEWTNSAYLPYPNFKIAEGAVGEYNGKFMINQMVLRGASIATAKDHSRHTYRNFFHPHFQWQFTGIRLAK